MASCANSATRKISTARSLSLPLESNLIITRITEELKRLKSWEESESSSSTAAESIGRGLSGIAELYGCVGEFLGLPLTQQSLSLHQNDAFLAHLVTASSRLLEICSGARAMALQLRGEASGKRISVDYFRTRKRVAKGAKQLRASLRGVEFQELEGAREDDGGRWRACAVIGVLRCVSIITVSVLDALASFLGRQLPTWRNKLPLIRRLMKSKGGLRNELENADVAMSALSSGDVADDVVCAALEGGMGGIVSGLESLSTQLTTIRAYLLQIFSF